MKVCYTITCLRAKEDVLPLAGNPDFIGIKRLESLEDLLLVTAGTKIFSMLWITRVARNARDMI